MIRVTPPDEVNAELKDLRAQLHLTRAQIADITHFAPSTVDAWLFPVDNPNARKMPDYAMRLLRLELGLDTPAYRHLREEAEELVKDLKGE